MWLLTTRNRERMCQEVITSGVQHGMKSPGIVWCDGCSYSLNLPLGWMKVVDREHQNIGAILRGFLERYPDEPWYGWMADDCIPLSEGWDKALIEAAGRKYVAYPDDGWQQGKKESDGTPHVTSIVCMGGDFVRAMGMLALPGQVQMYIDDVWESVAVPSGAMRYCPDVKSEHRHFANGKRQADETDTRVFRGRPFPQDDRALYRKWLGSREHMAAIERVRCLP